MTFLGPSIPMVVDGLFTSAMVDVSPLHCEKVNPEMVGAVSRLTVAPATHEVMPVGVGGGVGGAPEMETVRVNISPLDGVSGGGATVGG